MREVLWVQQIKLLLRLVACLRSLCQCHIRVVPQLSLKSHLRNVGSGTKSVSEQVSELNLVLPFQGKVNQLPLLGFDFVRVFVHWLEVDRWRRKVSVFVSLVMKFRSRVVSQSKNPVKTAFVTRGSTLIPSKMDVVVQIGWPLCSWRVKSSCCCCCSLWGLSALF